MKLLLISMILFFGFTANALNRALYVDGFAAILGNTLAENTLLQFAQDRNIDKLLLYQLHVIDAQHDLTNASTNQILADFISKAKTQYGIVEIAAVGENSEIFHDRFLAYNSTRTFANEKFDVFNLEFEFWGNDVNPGGYYCTSYLQPNGFSCDNAGGFTFFMQELNAIKLDAQNSSHPISTEAYVGWPTTNQSQAIQTVVDKILIHAYVTSPTTAFSYTDTRLYDFGSNNSPTKVSLIYSSEPAFMQNWLLQNDILQAENIYRTDFNANSNPNLDSISLVEFTYFTYSDFVNVVLDQTASQKEIQNNSFELFPNPASSEVTIQYNTPTKTESPVEIFSVLGERIYSHPLISAGTNSIIISIENLEKGYYFISIGSNELMPLIVSK